MSTEIAGMNFVLVILTLITIIIVVVIWQALKTARSKTKYMAELCRDEAYRKLAEEAVSFQKKTAEDLNELRLRVAAIEKILREVN